MVLMILPKLAISFHGWGDLNGAQRFLGYSS
jgi:hypothetical protein